MTMPRTGPVKPMLCKLQMESDLPILTSTKNYIFEPKLDGTRMITVVHNGEVRMWARSGIERTNLFPDLKFACTKDCVLDGEVISGNSFNNIQHRANRVNGIEQAVKDYPAKYVVFDIISLEGTSLYNQPLMTRKAILTLVCLETDNVKPIQYVDDGVALFNAMKANQLEGVVGKTKTGFYYENKREWVKVKCWQDSQFAVVGYTQGTGWRASTFGALVLADTNGFFVGEVGTGFTEAAIKSIFAMMAPNIQLVPPMPTLKVPEKVTWVKPFMVNVRFLEKTNQGQLRFPAYKGIV
jgi:bifunctional non-homologous end joining protein LigD